MREIKFRGKIIDNGEWVYGDLLHYFMCEDGLVYNTVIRQSCIYPVIPETVGQSTSMKDKNDKEIHEGDIVNVPAFNPENMIVGFIEGAFY